MAERYLVQPETRTTPDTAVARFRVRHFRVRELNMRKRIAQAREHGTIVRTPRLRPR